MDKKYIVAIDGGTQSTKVTLFDTVGTEICSHSVKLRPMHLYGESRAEHPDDDLWDSLIEACQGMFQKFDGDRRAILGVGLGSIRCCRALLLHQQLHWRLLARLPRVRRHGPPALLAAGRLQTR